MAEWETNVSSSGKDAVIRGEKLEEVMDMEFSDAIWLILKGNKPGKNESKLFKTILSSSIDHGVGNPSTVAARTVQSGGNNMNTSVAAGLMALGDSHGGAVQEAMEILRSDRSAEDIVKTYIREGNRVPGLGHKIYEGEDPRASKILEKAEKLGLAGEAVEKIDRIRAVLAEEKVELILNVDGAIAAVMTDLGWEPELGKGFFIIARTPGLVAHVREEMDEKPFRRQEGKYTGEE